MPILPVIDAAKEELTEIFKDLHEHPEIGFTEARTAKVVAEKLRAYGVDEVHEGIAKTGVVALIKGKSDSGRRVGLRADMDALPVPERVDLPWASKAKGIFNDVEVPVMHACGHDAHMAILLGTAEVLAGMRDQIPGVIKFIFQPAEEGPPPGEEGGAAMMIKEGVLAGDYAPGAIFGLQTVRHVLCQPPDVTVKNVGVRGVFAKRRFVRNGFNWRVG